MWSEKPSPGDLRGFWERQSRKMWDFREAASTKYYFEGECRIIGAVLPRRETCRALKLDLWNEVKNTNILGWMADQGAQTFAVDISQPLVRAATHEFREENLVPRFSVASLYNLPFKSDSFDFLYSMGTIEHAPDMGRCVREIHRILKPGGVAIVGVPNKHDPFLRPLLVHILNLCNAYPYGLEQSLTRRQLAALLRIVGLEIIGDEGVLFMPGIVRMIELAFIKRAPLLGRAVGALHWPFRLLARIVPRLHRHGYLIACVTRKPSH